MNKQKLLISFSGGRTSAFMTKWIIDNLSDQFEFVVVFANTGKEREETLEFVHNCDIHFGFNTVWVEGVINPIHRKGTTHKIVSFETVSRNGEPFEEMIKKYGIPNVAYPHCTRELKTNPIHSFVKPLGWDNYYTAIGIRADEVDRISKNWKEKQFLYPLISMIPTKFTDVNKFWLVQSFDLLLKSYEGNCDLCWKKSEIKLKTILIEGVNRADWWRDMQNKYSYFIPESRNSENVKLPIQFFRENKSIDDLIEESKKFFQSAKDTSKIIEEYVQQSLFNHCDVYEYGCSESCEPFI